MPQPDRSLRRLVAQLAELNPQDRADILATLSPAERAAIEPLLSDSGEPGGSEMSGLSPWLAERATDRADPTPRGFGGYLGQSPPSHRTSPVAQDALREAIKALHPGAAPPHREAAERGSTWLSRLFAPRKLAP